MLFPSFFNASAGGYEIEQSLRFDGSSGFTRTHSNNNTSSNFTLSMWFKKSYNGENNMMLLHTNVATRYSYVTFGESSGDADQLLARGTSSGYAFNTSRKYRDNSAWYHIVLSVDIGTVTKAYVNGVLDQNTGATSGWYLNGTDPLGLGRTAAGGNYFNGYMAEVHFIDGQALDADSFGEFDNNGVWRPKRYTGSHGTNGFYLKFDPSATNGIGHDHSGNGNHWTPSGFTTSGTGTDVMSDTPTTNWCTLNPIYRSSYADSNLVYSEGSLKVTSNANNKGAVANFAVSSGKWYYEATKTNDEMIGWHPADTALTNYPGGTVGVSLHSGGNVYHDGSNTAYGSSNTAAVIGCAVDFDNEKFYWSINGTWQNSADPAANTGGFSFPTSCQGVPLVPAFRVRSASSSENIIFNAGQRAFAYTPPSSDFKPLNTSNLPAPTVKDGSDYFNTVLYTGNGSTQSITGVGFSPSFVWTKGRSGSYGVSNHKLFDTVRGATKTLFGNLTLAEATQTNGLTSFDSDGFSLGNDTNVNASSTTFVAWNWLAGASQGFDIVTHTNTNDSTVISHSLGVTPEFIITKSTDTSTTQWRAWHTAGGTSQTLILSTTEGYVTSSERVTAVSSSNFTYNAPVTANGSNFIHYVFAGVEGYSKFGSYTGNGSGDGPFVHTGFAVRWLLWKKSSSTSNWIIWDTERHPNNVMDSVLFPNSSAAEDTNAVYNWDFLSNGFKVRTGSATINDNGATYIFMALAENPFGGSGVSPATAR